MNIFWVPWFLLVNHWTLRWFQGPQQRHSCIMYSSPMFYIILLHTLNKHSATTYLVSFHLILCPPCFFHNFYIYVIKPYNALLLFFLIGHYAACAWMKKKIASKSLVFILSSTQMVVGILETDTSKIICVKPPTTGYSTSFSKGWVLIFITAKTSALRYLFYSRMYVYDALWAMSTFFCFLF